MSTTTVDRLRAEASTAAELRACQMHPDVVALRIERMRAWFDRLMWSGIALGLAFTMINVQAFAAAGARSWSLPWLAAWLLDPTVSVILIAVLLAEQVTSRWQLATPGWARAAKWFALAATYAMNTWQSWSAGDLAAIVLHSVPPLMVFMAVEAAPAMRERLTEAVQRAAAHAVANGHRYIGPAPVVAFTAPAPVAASAERVNAERVVVAAVTNGATPAATNGRAPAGERVVVARQPRKLLADYVAEALAAYKPGVDVTPAWARSVTDCSRGLSPKVAAAVRAKVT